MDLKFEQYLAKSSTITVFSGVDTPSPGFSTITVSRTEEELGPDWAMDDVYPPLAELRRVLLSDEEWAAMTSWEKDVWEMFYRPDWERLACIEQILEGTPAAQRAQIHEEILEALRNLGASASKQTSGAAATSFIDNHDASHAIPVDAVSSSIGTEVAAPTCPTPEQDIDFPSVSITTVALLHKAVSELVHHDSSSPTIIDPKTLDMDPSAPTGFISTTPVNCSTNCLPQLTMGVRVLVASLPSTQTEYGLDNNSFSIAATPLATSSVFKVVPVSAVIVPAVELKQLYNDCKVFGPSSIRSMTSSYPVHRPMPWPSFMDVHEYADEARPLPWPSFREIISGEFPSHAVAKVSGRCISDSSHAKICVVIGFQFSDFRGNLFTYHGYIIMQDLCNSMEWICWDVVLLFLENWGSAIDNIQSACTYHTTLVWLPCTVSRYHLQLIVIRRLEMKLLSNDYIPITLLTVLLASGSCVALSCEYSGMDWHMMDFPCRPDVTVCLACSPETHYYFCSSQLKKSLIMHSMRSRLFSYDSFPVQFRMLLIGLGTFVTVSRMNLMLFVASRGSPWLVSCVCDDPTIISSIVVQWDELALQPWDPGDQIVTSDFTKVSYFQAIFDIHIKKLLLHGLKVSRFNVSVFLLSSKCCHKPTYTRVYDLLMKIYDAWYQLTFNVQTYFLCLNQSMLYTYSVSGAKQALLMFHKLRPPEGIFIEWSNCGSSERYCCVSLSFDLQMIIPLADTGSSSHCVLLSFCGKPQRISRANELRLLRGHITQCGFELLHCHIALSVDSDWSELASTKFKTSWLPNKVSYIPVDEQSSPTAVCVTELGGAWVATSEFDDAAATSAPDANPTARAALFPTHSADEDDMDTRKQYIIPMQGMKFPWNPRISTCGRWFFTCCDTEVLSVCNTWASEFQQLKLCKYLLIHVVATQLRVNHIKLLTGENAQIRCDGPEFKCIIMRPNYFNYSTQTNKVALQFAATSNCWLPAGVNDKANQHRRVSWNSGFCMFELGNNEKWWTTAPLRLWRSYHLMLIWSWDPGIISDCHYCTALVSGHSVNGDCRVPSKHYKLLVQFMKVSSNAGSSHWCQWFFTRNYQAHFQGGRYTITTFEPVVIDHSDYLHSGDTHSSYDDFFDNAYHLNLV